MRLGRRIVLLSSAEFGFSREGETLVRQERQDVGVEVGKQEIDSTVRYSAWGMQPRVSEEECNGPA